MRKILSILIIFAITLYSQMSNPLVKNWIKLVEGAYVYTSDKGTYNFKQNGDIILDSGNILTLVGVKSTNQAYYTYTINLSDMYMNAPNITAKMVEGYAVVGGILQSADGLLDGYNEKLNNWMELNATYDDYNTEWIINNNANWKTYPMPKIEDIDWSTLQNIGKLQY